MKGHRFFAAAYDAVTAAHERAFLGSMRSRVAGDARGVVVDLGSGTGADLPYFTRATRVVAIEPDPHMIARARRRAADVGRRIHLVRARAERLPLADASVDVVVAALVFCTVEDPAASLAEVKRVLRPGGELRFLEHVRAPTPGWARFQRAVRPLWRVVAAGCSPDRDTLAAIRLAGFRIDETTRVDEGTYPARPFVHGAATKVN